MTAATLAAVYLYPRDDRGNVDLSAAGSAHAVPGPREQIRRRLERLGITDPAVVDAEFAKWERELTS